MMIRKIYNLIQHTLPVFVLLLASGVALAEQDMPFQILGNYDVATKRGGLAIPEAALTPTEPVRLTEKEYQTAASIHKAQELIQSQQYNEAIALLDAIIAQQQVQYKNEARRIYSARTLGETLVYTLKAREDAKDAVIVSVNWSYAYFLKAYALAEMKQGKEAVATLKQALVLSPQNSLYLSELGNYYQRQKNWEESINIYKQAEEANSLAPDDLKNNELATIWRSVGYALIETGQLDEAEKMYRKCLDLDENDMKAKNELAYIANLKSKAVAKP